MLNRPPLITIPPGLQFAALGLARDPVTLEVSFDWTPILAICQASGIDPGFFRLAHENRLGGLIATWYSEHRAQGGAPDPVAEQIFAEVQAETVAGDPARVISHGGGIQ